ncbi:MAG: 3-isopropylmalate dehydratase small subunit [Candidatus Electryoneaceae bacterium]|nr:3-isopropylmalate dehydratase small subunit [Candidatus Electryoneaceae bacterium]
MPFETLHGCVFKYGDSIDTDGIIPARYCTNYHAEALAPHCLEDVDATFVERVSKGDIIVAGENFGCGSSRENAPIAIKGAGVSCVIAKSFARIFYRNSINIGLPILIAPDAVDGIEEGDDIEVDPANGTIRNLTRGGQWQADSFPEDIEKIIKIGGLVNYVKGRLGKT